MANLVIRVIDAYVFYQSDNGLEYLLLKRAKTKMYDIKESKDKNV